MKELLSTEHAAQLFGKCRRTFERKVKKWHVDVQVIVGPKGPQHFYRREDVEWMKKQAA